jgi:hypothetical protein
VPRHVARLVSRIVARLVVDYFDYVARLGASTRRAAHRLSSTTSPTPRGREPQHVVRLVLRIVAWLVVDYFAYTARLGASARRAAHRLSSTTSPTPRVRVPWHVARPVTRLVVDYSVRRDFVLRPRWLYFSHVVHRDYLSCGNTGSTSRTPHAATTSSSGRIASTIHL